jgi:molybdopterin-guanine dinucleotide biosynthesis protein B
MSLPVIAIVGTSNSGKTTVASALIHTLAARGYRIAAIKHCHNGHQVDRPGTDSARLLAAGAGRVTLSSPGQMTSIELTQTDAALEEIVASLDSSYDLVVAEGFKDSSVPKVLVLAEEELSPPPGNVIAVVGDSPTMEGVPSYGVQELDGLASHVQDQVLGRMAGAADVTLVVDGVPVPLGDFSSTVLSQVVLGFLKALRDVPTSPQRVRIALRTEISPTGSKQPIDSINATVAQ